MADTKFDVKWLKGLRFKGSEEKIDKDKSGRRKRSYKPFERDLRISDVLSFSENADTVTIVTTDGQKHVVDKTEKK